MNAQDFAELIRRYNKGQANKEELGKALYKLAELVCNTMRFDTTLREDLIADAVLELLNKQTWRKVDYDQSASSIFAYFWGQIRWTMLSSWKRHYTKTQPATYEELLDSTIGPLTILPNNEPEPDVAVAVVKREKKKSGRKPLKFWEEIFVKLREERSMSFTKIKSMVDPKFLENFDDPDLAIKNALYRYGRRHGIKVSIKRGIAYAYEI